MPIKVECTKCPKVCNDESEMSFEEKRGHCTEHGNLTCGACVCDEYFYGKMCECEGTSELKEDSCKASPKDNKKVTIKKLKKIRV